MTPEPGASERGCTFCVDAGPDFDYCRVCGRGEAREARHAHIEKMLLESPPLTASEQAKAGVLLQRLGMERDEALAALEAEGMERAAAGQRIDQYSALLSEAEAERDRYREALEHIDAAIVAAYEDLAGDS